MVAHVIDCADCGHCQDLHDETEGDAKDLKKTRRKIRKHVKRWLGEERFPEGYKGKRRGKEILMSEVSE